MYIAFVARGGVYTKMFSRKMNKYRFSCIVCAVYMKSFYQVNYAFSHTNTPEEVD